MDMTKGISIQNYPKFCSILSKTTLYQVFGYLYADSVTSITIFSTDGANFKNKSMLWRATRMNHWGKQVHAKAYKEDKSVCKTVFEMHISKQPQLL